MPKIKKELKRLAIIPARGGSKRIPHKNIKDFLGKPILAYSIEAALKSGLYDEVMVSTDNLEIANIALKYGAKVPFMRSDNNSNDYATTVDVLVEVIDWYKKNDLHFDQVTCIYACAPFVTPDLLKLSFTFLMNQKCDCVFPVIAYKHPIQRALKIHNNRIVLFNKEEFSSRTQDLDNTYHDAGMFYSFNTESLVGKNDLLTKNTCPIEIDEFHGQDIDTQNDWKLAELKHELLQSIT